MSSQNNEKWQSFIDILRKDLSDYDNEVRNLVKATGLSEKTLRESLKQVPKKRETILYLCYAFRAVPEEVDFLLSRMGYPRLYSKNADDAVWIYLFNNREKMPKSMSAPVLHDRYMALYEEALNKQYELSERSALGTSVVSEKLNQVETDEAFAKYVSSYLPELLDRYSNLVNYICKVTGGENAYQAISSRLDERKWGQAYKRISDARNPRTRLGRLHLCVLKRAFLIALGIELSFCADAINKLLEKGLCKELDPEANRTERLIELLLLKAESTKPGSTIGWTRAKNNQEWVQNRIQRLMVSNVVIEEYDGERSVSEYVYSMLEVNNCENIPRLSEN